MTPFLWDAENLCKLPVGIILYLRDNFFGKLFNKNRHCVKKLFGIMGLSVGKYIFSKNVFCRFKKNIRIVFLKRQKKIFEKIYFPTLNPIMPNLFCNSVPVSYTEILPVLKTASVVSTGRAENDFTGKFLVGFSRTKWKRSIFKLTIIGQKINFLDIFDKFSVRKFN